MAAWEDVLGYKPANIEEIHAWNVDVSNFDKGAEQRRELAGRSLVGFKIRSPRQVKATMQSWRAFFDARRGAATGFTFVSPFDDVEYTVRFEGERRCIFTRGYFATEINLKIITAAEA